MAASSTGGPSKCESELGSTTMRCNKQWNKLSPGPIVCWNIRRFSRVALRAVNNNDPIPCFRRLLMDIHMYLLEQLFPKFMHQITTQSNHLFVTKVHRFIIIWLHYRWMQYLNFPLYLIKIVDCRNHIVVFVTLFFQAIWPSVNHKDSQTRGVTCQLVSFLTVSRYATYINRNNAHKLTIRGEETAWANLVSKIRNAAAMQCLCKWWIV